MIELNDRGLGPGKAQQSPNADRDPKYDAYYWIDTGEWIEPPCRNPDCEFCAGRPDKHSS